MLSFLIRVRIRLPIVTRLFHKIARLLKEQVFAFLFVTFLMLGIITGVHYVLENTIDNTIAERAEKGGFKWAKFFATKLPNIEVLVSTGIPTERQEEIIQSIIDADDVFRFLIFDPEGHLVYVSDIEEYRIERGPNVNEIAFDVYSTGKSWVEVRSGVDNPHRPVAYAQTIVPVVSQDDVRIGTVEVFTDQTKIKDLLRTQFQPILYALPFLCAMLYLIPSLGFVLKANQLRKRALEVEHLNRYDTLTGVLNRGTLTKHLDTQLKRKKKAIPIGVMFIDVDKFKEINDQYGHEFGDVYLCHIADKLQTILSKRGLVGRMGGDEFVLTVQKLTRTEFVTLAEVLRSKINRPFRHRGQTIVGSISIGCYHCKDNELLRDIVHKADLALYSAKTNGRNRVEHYCEGLEGIQARRRLIEDHLQIAFEKDRFHIQFQPIINATNKKVAGFEALLRIDTDCDPPLSPAEFIPIAEEIGLIDEIGLLVLRKSIVQAKLWPDNVFISVNLSPLQFRSGTIFQKTRNLLDELGFPTNRLEFEITESTLANEDFNVAKQLLDLSELGITIAMDDFGTGYSSLGHLWQYPFDKLKIDRSFLLGFDDNHERHRDIIETIVTLGHKMGMRVVAEGIEKEDHVNLLEEVKCDLYQGFFFGKPMSGALATEFLLEEGVCSLKAIADQGVDAHDKAGAV